MSFPSITTRIAFATAPFADTPTWEDVSSLVREINIRRGRQHEMDRIEASVATIVLDNSDGRFWPANQGALANLVTNPSFEGDGPGTPSGWSAVAGSGTVNIYVDADPMFGSQSMLLVTAGGTGSAQHIVGSGWSVGDELVWSAYVKSTTGVGISLLVGYEDGSGWHWAAWGSSSGTTSSTYTRVYSDPLNIQAGWLNVGVRISHNGAGESEIDGVQVEIASTPSTYTDGDQDNCRWSGTAHASTTYRGGPYYPNVKPRKRLNIRATYSATTYDEFTGLIESYLPGYTGDGKVAIVTITAVDILKNLSQLLLNDGTGYAQQLSNLRVGEVLDDLGWPAADRDLNTGQTTVIATGAIANVNALDHLNKVQETELGIVFVAGDGDVQFQDRHARLAEPFLTPVATFGDGAGELGYRDPVFAYDDQYIYNDVRVTRSGGAEQTASNATSQTDYGKSSLSRTDLLQTTDAEALSQAQYLLARYEQPALRLRGLTIRPQADEANVFPVVLAADVSTRITVRLDAASIDGDYHVEGVEHIIRPHFWETRLVLSNADEQPYWVLGYGALGETNALIY